MAKSYPPKFKFQVVLELLQGEHSVGQLAKSYSVHPNSVLKWKRQLLENGPQVFERDNSAAEYEARIAQLEQLLGKKEVEIAREHSEYGYRRTTTELRETYGQQVNHKVVRRLHALWDLALLRTTRKPKRSAIRQLLKSAGDRVNLLAGMTTVEPLMVLYTDFTELRYAEGVQKAQLMAIIGHAGKMVFGWAVGEGANRQLAAEAWRRARETFKALGVDPAGIIMHHDQDTVYTSYAWTGLMLLEEKLRLSYSLDGARGNTEMEAFFSRFKNENRSLILDAPTLEALRRSIDERIRYFNDKRRHSTLGNQPPRPTLEKWLAAKTGTA